MGRRGGCLGRDYEAGDLRAAYGHFREARPFGRGVNFQLELDEVASVYSNVVDAGHDIVVALEERWYQVGAKEAGNRQFVVADPDGYLIRPFTSLGARIA
jgi:hypothetical protein